MKQIYLENDEFTVEIGDELDWEGDLPLVLEADDGGDAVQVWPSKDEAVEIADAIYEATGTTPGVKASDIPLNEALLRVAAAHNVEASFKYTKSVGSPVEYRTLVPAKVTQKDDHVTFTGFDPDRGAIRAFRSDRIKGKVSL